MGWGGMGRRGGGRKGRGRPAASTHMFFIVSRCLFHESVPGPSPGSCLPFSPLGPEGPSENPPREGAVKRLRNSQIICFGLN